jgi:hypothetical protein
MLSKIQQITVTTDDKQRNSIRKATLVITLVVSLANFLDCRQEREREREGYSYILRSQYQSLLRRAVLLFPAINSNCCTAPTWNQQTLLGTYVVKPEHTVRVSLF